MNPSVSAYASRFAGRLKELREQAGLTQPALAERAGLSKGGIADLEQGRREPSWATVLTLATALGVTCLEFLEPPAARPPTGRGRPPKQTEESAKPTSAAPRRRRGERKA